MLLWFMSTLSNLTVAQLKQALALRERIETLETKPHLRTGCESSAKTRAKKRVEQWASST
jgi:hypothetical protein